jgi:hypothetical protein
LARDAVAAVNDELGAAMIAAIEKKAPASAKVTSLAVARRKKSRKVCLIAGIA